MRRFVSPSALVTAFALVLAASAAHAAQITFTTTLAGTNEVPANLSTATGTATVVIDTTANTLDVNITWAGLTGGNPSAAHIHCCTVPGTSVGVAVGFVGFPATLSGTYTRMFDLSDPAIYTSAFRTNVGGGTAQGAAAALQSGMLNGLAYVNIHNSIFPGGEIRGQLAVPEPGILLLVGSGLLSFVAARRRRT